MYEILKSLEKTSKTLEKAKILEENKDCMELQLFFESALSKTKNYWIKETTFPDAPHASTSKYTITDFIKSFLPKLYNREVTGNEALNQLAIELSNYSKEDQDIIKRIILKDPKCGVSDKQVNKVWNGLVLDVPYMRCSGPEKMKNIIYPAIIQEKSDGTFCNIIVLENTVQFLTRNGSSFYVDSLAKEILKSDTRNVVFIGELIMVENFKVLDRKTGNGNITKLIRAESALESVEKDISNSKANKIETFLKKRNDMLSEYDRIDNLLHINCWDIIPLEDWYKGVFECPYSERFASLNDIIKRNKFEKISSIPHKIVYSSEEAASFNAIMLKDGKEGSVIKNLKSFFKDGTSTEQVKMKVVLEADLLCVSWYPGEKGTAFENGLGGLELESSDGKLKVSVGSGFLREQRGMEPFDKNDIAKGICYSGMDFDKEYVGKIITIEYNAMIESKDKPGLFSCFLPVFIEVRHDKTEADSFEKISAQ